MLADLDSGADTDSGWRRFWMPRRFSAAIRGPLCRGL